MNEHSVSRMNPFIIGIICVILLLMGSFGRDLWTPDEPRVAAISLEMSRGGDYLVPHLSGIPFVEKPPLYFAVAAGFINALGRHIGNVNAIRQTSVMFGIGTLLMTFLLARRLYGKDGNPAILAAAVLSTMVGFVLNFHWIRVDAALIFFVIAAVWCLAEVYLAQKFWFCLPAGLFCAGAFLSKGPVGPILVAIPLLILFVLGMIRPYNKTGTAWTGFILFHVAGLLLFIVLSGSWILYLKIKGGADLWNQWFWTNQVGRMMGTSAALGHIRRGRPFYYLVQTVISTLPWFPLILFWLGSISASLFKRRSISRGDFFLFAWGACTLLLLSLSATKRPIYMAPLLPAFALMCIPVLPSLAQNKWIRGYGYFWIGLCAVLLAVFALVPLAATFLPHKIPAPALAALRTFGPANALSGAACLACLYLLFSFGKAQKAVGGFLFASALLYIGMFAVPVKAVDAAKSMRTDIMAFTGRIPAAAQPHIAGYDFNETMLGCFYFYSNWAVPQITDKARVARIIAGTDPQYDSIIINKDMPRQRAVAFIKDLAPSSCRILDVLYTGDRDSRGVFWVKGADLSYRKG